MQIGCGAPRMCAVTSQQRNWFFSYSSSTQISWEDFVRERLEVDQVVTSKDLALNYVYFHLVKKVRQSSIWSFVEAIRAQQGFRIREIFGFDAISCMARGGDIHTHPGFRTLVRHDQENHSHFSFWSAGRLRVGRGYMHLRRCALKDMPAYEETDDVVKKRRMMDAAHDEDDSAVCPVAQQRFEEFESNVLGALSEDYRRGRWVELLEMERAFSRGCQPSPGFVYVAISDAIKYPKIGATRRSDPSVRLKELSRYVPSPFRMVYAVPTLTPFELESEIHAAFDAARIKEKGACTEFFNADLHSIGEYLKQRFEDCREYTS